VDVDAFDFELPESLIAQDPPAERGGSRLLVLNRQTGVVEHTRFTDVARYLRPGDLLVVNNTRVFPARLLGVRVPSGGAVECLLVARLADRPEDRPVPTDAAEDGDGGEGHAVHTDASDEREGRRVPADGSEETWEALMHPGQKLKPGARVLFERAGARLHGEVLERRFYGRRTVRLWTDAGSIADAIERIGHIPLPPYIKREDRPSDRERYQTVFARNRGSIAAPTAGLHFTEALLAALTARGVMRADITLHVGYGTFKPVRAARVEDHVVDPEPYEISSGAADAINRALDAGRRVIAVGTTTTRALEDAARKGGARVRAGEGRAEIFIHPPFDFLVISGLLTNFHLPKSSLLMLVSAFAGRPSTGSGRPELVVPRPCSGRP